VTRRKLVGLVRAGLVAALVVPAIAVSPASAGSETGQVVFHLTLEGPVPASHTFAIECGAAPDPCGGPESSVIVCSPPNAIYDYESCEPTTYEVGALIPVGRTIEYTLLRWTTPDLAHTDDQPEEHLPGSWTVHGGRQVISLTFDYSATSVTPVLPDTAMSSQQGIPRPAAAHRGLNLWRLTDRRPAASGTHTYNGWLQICGRATPAGPSASLW